MTHLGEQGHLVSADRAPACSNRQLGRPLLMLLLLKAALFQRRAWSSCGSLMLLCWCSSLVSVTVTR